MYLKQLFKKIIVIVIMLSSVSCVKTEIDPAKEININLYGDSLTEGAGGNGLDYAYYLQELLNRKVNNKAIGGQIAQQIAARQGGLELYITINGNKFVGPLVQKILELKSELNGILVDNFFLSSPSNNPASISGSVNGIKCDIIYNGTEYSIIPRENITVDIPPGSQFIPNTVDDDDTYIGVYWVGRNNTNMQAEADGTANSVLEVISKMVRNTKSGRFVILGIINGLSEIKGTPGYNRITLTNEKLASLYGSHFVSMTPPTNEEMASVNFIPTTVDLEDIENGVFPRGLRFDSVHPNSMGYKIIANRVFDCFKQNSY